MISLPYVAIMLLALGSAIVLSRGRHRALPLRPGQRLLITVGAFVGAIFGAKLPFALSDHPGLLSGHAWLAGGKTILFGLVGGYAGVEVVKRALGVRIKTGDTFVVPVAVAIAIGRLGCFVAGCCHGTPTELPWGVVFADGVPRHPTQLYEFLFHASAALVILWMERREILRCQRIKLYILAYLVYRILSEFIRPEPRVELGLTVYQWSALAFIPLFVLLWRRDSRTLVTETAPPPGSDAPTAPALQESPP